MNENLARADYHAVRDGSATLEMRIALSYVSVEGALQNLDSERHDQTGSEETFDSTRNGALAAWDHALSTIKIQSSNEVEKRIFYTALYHSLWQPNVQDDVSGAYRGYDDQIYTLETGHHHYGNFSGWDVYRSEIQLLAILFPARASDMAQSLVSAAEQCGAIPQWAINNADTAVMGGDAGPIMLADFYGFGADHFDAKTALKYMIKHGSDPLTSCTGHLARPGLTEYLTRGYLPRGSLQSGTTSNTLEYAASDFAISRFAHALGDEASSAHFLKQSESWKNLWWQPNKGPSLSYIRGRNEDGKWIEPFFPDENPTMKDPMNPALDFDQGFVEGTAAQYSLMVPFDFPGVLSRMGTKSQIHERLTSFFSKVNGGLDAPYMHIGNEPSFSLPWILLWSHDPAANQEVVHRTIKTSFYDVPGGMPGNDDLGATSSWYVFATLGLYPAVPGVGGLAIHGPYFSDIELKPENGKLIHMKSTGTGFYIRDLSVNEKPYPRTWIDWSDLKDGANLNFSFTDQPSTWGSSVEDSPPSFDGEKQ